MVKKNNTQIRCRSCAAPMFWAETSNGKRIPLDQQPVHDGNMRILLRPGLIPLAFSLKELEGFAYTDKVSPGAYVSHFATCPQSKQWRKK